MPALADHPVANVRCLGRIDHLDDLQLDAPRGSTSNILRPAPNRTGMDLKLVQHTGLQRFLGRGSAVRHDVAIACRGLRTILIASFFRRVLQTDCSKAGVQTPPIDLSR
jgi:hypothetical protein